MFLIAGILLLSIIYLLAAQARLHGGQLLFSSTGGLQVSSATVRGSPDGQLLADEFNDAISECTTHQRRPLDTLLSRRCWPARPRRHRLRLRLRDGRPGAAPAGPDHPHRRARRRLGPARADRAGRPGRRAEGAGRHLRRHAGPARRAFTAQQRFVANASHELRTPLAINRTPLEVGLPDPAAPVEPSSSADPAGHQRAQRAARRGPAAARALRRASLRAAEPVDLADVLDHGRRRPPPRPPRRRSGDVAVEARPGRRRSRATRCCWSGSRTTWCKRGAPQRPRRLGARAARVRDGQAGLEVVQQHRAGGARRTRPLAVRAVPPGCGPAHGPGQGAGLGLSIVRAVARAHGGQVDAAAPRGRRADGPGRPAGPGPGGRGQCR